MMKCVDRLVLILLVVGGFLVWQSAGDFFISVKRAVDFNEISEDQFKAGRHVSGDVGFVLDSFATEESWTESKGSRTPAKTSSLYYVVPVGEESYIGLKAPVKQRADYEKVSDETYAYVMGELQEPGEAVVPFEGAVVEMDDELYGYFTEWFQESGFLEGAGDEAIRKVALPYLMEYRSFTAVRVLFAVGAALLLLDVLLLLRRWKKSAPQPETVGEGQTGPELP